MLAPLPIPPDRLRPRLYHAVGQQSLGRRQTALSMSVSSEALVCVRRLSLLLEQLPGLPVSTADYAALRHDLVALSTLVAMKQLSNEALTEATLSVRDRLEALPEPVQTKALEDADALLFYLVPEEER